MGAIRPSCLRPAVKVVVFQWPWGTDARQRSPRRARPLSLAIFAGSAFINENKLIRIEMELTFEPQLASDFHIFALLLGRVRCLFLYVMPRLSKNVQILPTQPLTPYSP